MSLIVIIRAAVYLVPRFLRPRSLTGEMHRLPLGDDASAFASFGPLGLQLFRNGSPL